MTKEIIIGNKQQRRARIGGSEFASVLDINPYKKRIELVLEKAGVIADTFEGNEATRRGERLENDIIAMFEDETGLSIAEEQREFALEVEDCLPLVCHIDGMTSDDCVFEAKTTDINSKTWNNGIPEYYKAQLEFNCMLAGKNEAYIAVGFCSGNEIVKFDYYKYHIEQTRETVIEKCRDFTNEVNKYRAYGVVNTGKIEKTNIDGNLINELELINLQISEIKSTLKPLEERKKQIENKFKDMIKTNAGIENDLYRITLGNRIVSPSSDYKISRSGLKIEYLK